MVHKNIGKQTVQTLIRLLLRSSLIRVCTVCSGSSVHLFTVITAATVIDSNSPTTYFCEKDINGTLISWSVSIFIPFLSNGFVKYVCISWLLYSTEAVCSSSKVLCYLTLLHSERPKLYTILAFLSAM